MNDAPARRITHNVPTRRAKTAKLATKHINNTVLEVWCLTLIFKPESYFTNTNKVTSWSIFKECVHHDILLMPLTMVI